MAIYVLDHTAILNRPSVLAARPKESKLIIPDVVLTVLKRRGFWGFSQLLKLIQSAAVSEATHYRPHDFEGIKADRLIFERDLIGCVKSVAIQHPNTKVFLVSDSGTMRAMAGFEGVDAVSSEHLAEALRADGATDPAALAMARSVVRNRYLHLLASLASGCLLILAVQYGLSNIGNVVTATSTVATFIGLMAFGVALFALRAWYRLTYGLLELGFGLTTVYLSLQNDLGVDSGMLGLVKLAGGMYILVRGLDNIGKGLKVQWPGLWSHWSRWFPE